MTPDLAEQIIRAALVHDPDYTFEDVLDAIRKGEATVFEAAHSLDVVQLRRYETGELEAYAWVGGGRMDEMRDDIRPRVEEFARRNGCDWIELRTRPAAHRILKRYGYEIYAQTGSTVTLRKSLHG